MDEGRLKTLLREALREEAEKIAAKGDALSMTLLLAGAEIRMAERIHGFTTNVPSNSDAFNKGREIADLIELDRV